MLSITADNVNYAYHEALWRMKIIGVESDSRNGKVRRAPGPVVTTYRHPKQRMLYDAQRDANPFFHIFEAIWMLAGRNDVGFPARFAKQIEQYSDDGGTLHGAYGYRWRNHWDEDQLVWAIEHLASNPQSRRAVINMWDPNADMSMAESGGKDVPCNTTVYFSNREGKLDMTVCCRSNDIIWGCYGANAVHMSMLQQFVAEALGWPVGHYVQFSNDWHIYEQHFPLMNNIGDLDDQRLSLYVDSIPLIGEGEDWRQALFHLTNWTHAAALYDKGHYVSTVLRPMYDAWVVHKAGDTQHAVELVNGIHCFSVRAACRHWLNRRIK